MVVCVMMHLGLDTVWELGKRIIIEISGGKGVRKVN